MLSVLAVGPAGAVGKWEPPKKDPKVCVKWVKVVKVNWDKKKSDTFKVKKFLWVKKSKFHTWKLVKDWDLGEGKKFFFFKVKKIDSKKACWDKNIKKFKKGSWKKPIFPEPPVIPPDEEFACLVHFTGSAVNPYNLLWLPESAIAAHLEEHTTDNPENRQGSDFLLNEYLESIEEEPVTDREACLDYPEPPQDPIDPGIIAFGNAPEPV